MNKNLKARINAMSKEQLIGLIEQMCAVADSEQLLRLMLTPTKASIDHALYRLSVRCEIYVGDSCNERDRRAMFKAAEPLYAAYQYADDKMGAYIIYGMHKAMDENDLIDSGGGEDYYAIVGELLGDLKSILEHSPELFSKEEFEAYSSIIELDET